MKKLLSCLMCLVLLGGCGTGQTVPVSSAAENQTLQEATRQVFAMDTFMELKACGPEAEAALAEAEELLTGLDRALSVTNPQSDIYRLNQGDGTPVTVSSDTAEVLQKGLELSGTLGESLELTIYPVLRAWGFTTGEYRVPEQAELDGLLACVGDARVAVEGQSVTLPRGAELDLGSVAKGWAGDRCAELLKARGITSALLNLGGSTIRTLGVKPDGSDWRIAIQDPEDPEGYAGVLELGEGAVDTSGGYERWFEEDGTVYWHILDPRTGYPAKSGLISVTVITEDSFTGDGLSTALFVMGKDEAIAYWRAHRDFEFVLIDDNGALWVSPGAAECLSPAGRYEDAPLTVVDYEA